jgi:hypothetical protein
MSTFPLDKEWKDFVTFPLEPTRIRTREARFDLSLASRGAFVIQRDYIMVMPDDVFEAALVDEHGDVLLWTRETVWTFERFAGMELEKSVFFPRYPIAELYKITQPTYPTYPLDKEWKDFVIFPKDPERIKSREERLDLSLVSCGAQVIRHDDIAQQGDVFEAMHIDAFSHVMFWTQKTVGAVRRWSGPQVERLLVVPRHPPKE